MSCKGQPRRPLHHSSFVIRHSSFVIRHSSFAITAITARRKPKPALSDGEPEEASVVKPAADGKGYHTKRYSLQAIIGLNGGLPHLRACLRRQLLSNT